MNVYFYPLEISIHGINMEWLCTTIFAKYISSFLLLDYERFIRKIYDKFCNSDNGFRVWMATDFRVRDLKKYTTFFYCKIFQSNDYDFSFLGINK